MDYATEEPLFQVSTKNSISSLLIIDELGYMPITREQANLLFQLISIRYERASIILTTNYNFDEWGRIFEDNVTASAIIDRLVHHAMIFYISRKTPLCLLEGLNYPKKLKSIRGSILFAEKGSNVLTINTL